MNCKSTRARPTPEANHNNVQEYMDMMCNVQRGFRNSMSFCFLVVSWLYSDDLLQMCAVFLYGCVACF